jgi:cytochrome c biogenesis protein CcdA
MGNMTDQPPAAVPAKRNNLLANVSVTLGILGFVLPCLAFFVLGFQLNDTLIDKVGLHEFNQLNVYIPMALWIVGPMAIMVGLLSIRKRGPENIPEIRKDNAKIGIVLGLLTIPCVLLPLIASLILVYACAQGC